MKQFALGAFALASLRINPALISAVMTLISQAVSSPQISNVHP
jgi:preprotein translocase subunit SecF